MSVDSTKDAQQNFQDSSNNFKINVKLYVEDLNKLDEFVYDKESFCDNNYEMSLFTTND